jgi:hypothetical protein
MKPILALLAAAIAAAPAAAVTNDFSNQLKKLSPLQQRATMRRAVLDEGKYCKRIGPVAYQGPYKNLEMWNVQCDRGAAYGVFIGLDGTVQVRPCEDLAQLKLPTCRIPKAK